MERCAVPPLAQFGVQQSPGRVVGTASGVVKSRTIKRLPPGERWNGSLLDHAHGSELAPHALGDDGGRVEIRARVLQPYAAVPLPPLVLEFRQVRRGSLATQTIALGVPTQELVVNAIDHSEQCRSNMEAILVTTTEGHMRLERARERFAQFAEEPGVMESPRKRHRSEGEGRRPLAPPGSTESGVRSNYQECVNARSGSALPASVPLAQRSLE